MKKLRFAVWGHLPGEKEGAVLQMPGIAAEELRSQQREEPNDTQDALGTEQLQEPQGGPANVFKAQSGKTVSMHIRPRRSVIKAEPKEQIARINVLQTRKASALRAGASFLRRREEVSGAGSFEGQNRASPSPSR